MPHVFLLVCDLSVASGQVVVLKLFIWSMLDSQWELLRKCVTYWWCYSALSESERATAVKAKERAATYRLRRVKSLFGNA